MRDPKQERRPASGTKNSSEPVQWQTNERSEDPPRESRDVETDREPSSQQDDLR